MNKLAVATAAITTAKTSEAITEIPGIDQLWIDRYQATTGKSDGLMKFENEKLLFLRVFQDNPKLENCDPFSKYTAFMDLCVSDLTLADGISYIFSMDNKKVIFMPSWKGRLEQINRMPHVAFAYDPEVVYDCDIFKLTRQGPLKTIEHQSNPDRTEENYPIHVYMYIEFSDGRVVLYEMSKADVLHIRDTRSRSHISYMKALNNEKLNPGKKIGDRVNIQYKNKSTNQWETMEIDPPMSLTDAGQYFKKTLVRRVYGSLPKLPGQIQLDQRIDAAVKDAQDSPACQMPDNQPDEVVDDLAQQQDEKFTDYEEIGNSEQVNKETGEISSSDLEGDTF